MVNKWHIKNPYVDSPDNIEYELVKILSKQKKDTCNLGKINTYLPEEYIRYFNPEDLLIQLSVIQHNTYTLHHFDINMPVLGEVLERFADEHLRKYSSFADLSGYKEGCLRDNVPYFPFQDTLKNK